MVRGEKKKEQDGYKVERGRIGGRERGMSEGDREREI